MSLMTPRALRQYPYDGDTNSPLSPPPPVSMQMELQKPPYSSPTVHLSTTSPQRYLHTPTQVHIVCTCVLEYLLLLISLSPPTRIVLRYHFPPHVPRGEPFAFEPTLAASHKRSTHGLYSQSSPSTIQSIQLNILI